MRFLFVVANVIVFCTVLTPIMWHLWIYAGSGNANFFFALTIVINAASTFLAIDLLQVCVFFRFWYLRQSYAEPQRGCAFRFSVSPPVRRSSAQIVRFSVFGYADPMLKRVRFSFFDIHGGRMLRPTEVSQRLSRRGFISTCCIYDFHTPGIQNLLNLHRRTHGENLMLHTGCWCQTPQQILPCDSQGMQGWYVTLWHWSV